MKPVGSRWSLVSLIISVLIFARCFCVEAQQPAKIPRIGWLDSSILSGNADLLEAFWQEMRKLGWIERKNIAIEYRFAENKGTGRVSELASDLVRLHVDLIVTSGAGPSVAARNATTTIPVVMANASDPVAAGLVTSLARPGGNIIGVAHPSWISTSQSR